VRNPELIVIQPTPFCNINCEYCYLNDRTNRSFMSNEVICAIRDKILAQLDPSCTATIIWHAGEPTALPLRWYENAYSQFVGCIPSGTVFAMQTNGVALSAPWVKFLQQTRTRVGLSIDGPQCWHDDRRKTKRGGPTWHLAVRSLKLLQSAGLAPNVITVLHPDGVFHPRDYFDFYRSHDLTEVSFSIDEFEGANRTSRMGAPDFKQPIISFLESLMNMGLSENYPLRIREVERISFCLASGVSAPNEQVEPWKVITIGYNGDVSTFSPEFMEAKSSQFNNFCFGNILDANLESFSQSPLFQEVSLAIGEGVDFCRRDCRYFSVCGGGAPINKWTENASLKSTETQFCRNSVQASTDALLSFISRAAEASYMSANG
jgi:uncharacterized protein